MQLHFTVEKNLQIKQVANVPRLLADLYEVMTDFKYVNAEWWELSSKECSFCL